MQVAVNDKHPKTQILKSAAIIYRLNREIKFRILSFGKFPGIWILSADVSEHSVPSWCVVQVLTPPMKMEQSVPKRGQIKFRCRGIIQKKEYNIEKTAKVWNQELTYLRENKAFS